MPLRNNAALAALALILPACSADARPEQREPLGLFTTLPIYWQESAEFGSMLRENGEPGRVRAQWEQEYEITPLDVLSADALAGVERLVLAQPRALSAAENVALDNWVRGGGKLLLFADPMLTLHSLYPLGDPRRPQDVVLLSPILARWGLELTFDQQQPEGERTIDALGARLPLHLHGAFRAQTSDAAGDCAVSAGGVIAQCRIGRGQVLLLADAAVLEEKHGHGETHDEGSAEEHHEGSAHRSEGALQALTDAAFKD